MPCFSYHGIGSDGYHGMNRHADGDGGGIRVAGSRWDLVALMGKEAFYPGRSLSAWMALDVILSYQLSSEASSMRRVSRRQDLSSCEQGENIRRQ